MMKLCEARYPGAGQTGLIREKQRGTRYAVIEQGGKKSSPVDKGSGFTIARALVRKPGNSDFGRQRLRARLCNRRRSSQSDSRHEKRARRSFWFRSAPPPFSTQIKIVVLDDGKIAGHRQTRRRCSKSCEVYREIYESQFKKEANC